MEKILSIIIPTYNMENYLRKCLDSLIISDENMKLLEVLIINDGSKDFSSEIGHEYESKYPQTFHVIDKENGNYGSCINRGLKEASGKYIKILDADDYFNNQIFNSYLNYLAKVDVDLVISDFDIVDEVGNIIKSVCFTLPENETFSMSQLSNVEDVYLWHHAVTYKHSLFSKIEYKQTEGISYSDEEWVFKPMAVVESVSYLHKCLYLYLRGREGQTYDSAVLKRTRNQKDIMVGSLVLFYEKYREKVADKGAADFMYRRVMMILKNMYKFYLYSNVTIDGNRTITDFDNQLKTKCRFLYDEIGNIYFKKKIPFNYIVNWRKSDYNPNSCSLLIYRITCYVIDKIKRKGLY